MTEAEKTLTVQGHEAWQELVGKEVSFDWTDGWDDFSDRYVVGGIDVVVGEDSRYPRYYVLAADGGGGVSFWENESVVVTVHD